MQTAIPIVSSNKLREGRECLMESMVDPMLPHAFLTCLPNLPTLPTLPTLPKIDH
jgi:hypothetical protein